MSIDGLAESLTAHFEVGVEIARSDVAEFLVSLLQFDVLEETPRKKNS